MKFLMIFNDLWNHSILQTHKKLSLFKNNKNCLGSFQVLWNKNCTTENEVIMMKNWFRIEIKRNKQNKDKNEI
jgi:hypothetical protein